MGSLLAEGLAEGAGDGGSDVAEQALFAGQDEHFGRQAGRHLDIGGEPLACKPPPPISQRR
jgi:hypothetical protein